MSLTPWSDLIRAAWMQAIHCGASAAALSIVFASLLAPAPALAQGCYMGGVAGLNFGQVSPDDRTDVSSTISYTCASNANPVYYRVCLFLAEGTPIAGINPRYMTNYNNAQMRYEIYADAARTQIIGPPPTGGGFPVVTSTLLVPAGYVQSSPSIPIYGRAPSGQSLPANLFMTGLGGSALYWAWSSSTYPASCMSGSGGNGSTNFYMSVIAAVSNACRITLATDLDFGNVASVSNNTDQTAQILVRCPTATSWKLGIGNGNNASSNTRRMRSAAGAYVNYELYRNAARTQRWGNAAGTDTSDGTGAGETSAVTRTVYGRVPAQATAPMGSYSDTVTVTLTY